MYVCMYACMYTYIYVGASERYFVWGGYLFIFYVLYPIMYY